MRPRSHHRTARNGPGFLCWSVLGGLATLRVPWSDILSSDGQVSIARLRGVLTSLRAFEAELTDKHLGDVWPSLPTPNAKIVRIDSVAFEMDLPRRVREYVSYNREQEEAVHWPTSGPLS